MLELSICCIVKESLFVLPLIITCLVGDKLVFTWLNGYSAIYRAIGVSLTHGFIGLFSWLIIEKSLLHGIICMALAMSVDADRFIEVGSLDLDKALNLDHRPFLHNSTIPVIFYLISIIISYLWKNYNFRLFTSLIFMAFITHHLRDASRRGLWFYPWIHSLPLPYPTYIIVTILLSFIVKFYVSQTSKSYDVISV